MLPLPTRICLRWLSEQTEQLMSSAAAGQAIRANARGVAWFALLQVVANVPERAIVARVDVQCRIVFPPQAVRLRSFARCHHGFMHSHLSLRISREPSGKALPRKARRATE